MLQDIRDKSQGWIAKTIIGVIVLLFALTGFDAIFRAVSHDGEVATVNGEKITKTEFTAIYEQQKYILSTNEQFDGTPEATAKLRKLVIDNLINYRILIQAATNAKLGYLPEAFIKQSIENNPLYKTDGKFDYKLFEQDLRNYGYASDIQFVKDQLDQRFLGQLQSGIVDANFAIHDETIYLARLFGQTRDFSYKQIDASKIINVSDKEIEDWYETHKDNLKTPEQVVLEYVELKRDDFLNKATVSDEELKNLYTKKVIALDKEALRQRIAHILIPVTSTQNDAQAKAKIDEIANELKQGKDFATLAKQDSQDLGTANKGGDLGFVTINELPDPAAFAPALQKLTKVGDISEPIRSRFGWHIIKLTDIQRRAIPDFEALRNQLANELKQQKAYDAYLVEQKKLDAAAFENYDNLGQVAKDFNLTLNVTKPFSKDKGYDLITASDKVVKAAFSATLLENKENSNIIEIAPNISVIIRVKEHLQPTKMTLVQATPEITKALQKDKAKVAGEKLITDLKTSKVKLDNTWKTLTAVKQPINLDVTALTELGVSKKLVEAVFVTPKPIVDKPSIGGVVLDDGNYAVIVLTKVNEPKEPLSTADDAQYQDLVTTSLGNKLWTEYQKYLKDKAEIKYFETE